MAQCGRLANSSNLSSNPSLLLLEGGPSSRGMGPVDKELWITQSQGTLSVGGNRFLIPKVKGK